MKTLRYFTGLLGMLVLAAGLCAKDFEGKIRFKMTGQDGPAKRSNGNAPAFMDYYLKGGLMRIGYGCRQRTDIRLDHRSGESGR